MVLPTLKPWQIWLLLGGIAFATLALRFHVYSQPISQDPCVYAYVGHQMLSGEKLYGDLVDNKPPGIYFLYMLAIALGGYSQENIFWLGVIFTLASLFLVFRILQNLAGSVTALAGAAAWALVSNSIHICASQPNTETFINFLLLAAFACLVRSLRSKPEMLWLSGFAFAAASVIKTNVVFIVGIVSLYLFWFWWHPKSLPGLKIALRNLAQLAWPGALVWTGLFFYFLGQGTWDEFVDVVFKSLRVMARNVPLNEWHALTTPALHTVAFKHEVLLLLGFSLLWGVLKKLKRNLQVWEGLFPVWGLGALAMVSSVSFPPAYYYHVLFPPLVILFALSFRAASDFLPRPSRWRWPFLLGLGLAGFGTLGMYALNYLATSPEAITTFQNSSDRNTEKKLGLLFGALTKPGDTIYQWGLAPILYFYSRRQAASGVVMTHIMSFSPEDVVNKLKNKIFQSVTQARPAFIIFHLWNGDFKEIMIYPMISSHYRYFGNYDKMIIFVRNDHAYDTGLAEKMAQGISNHYFRGIKGSRLLLAQDTPEAETWVHVNQPVNRRLAVAQGETPEARMSRAGNQAALKGDWQAALSAWSQSRVPESDANLGILFERQNSQCNAMNYYQLAYQKLGPPWDDYYRQVQWKLIYQAQYQVPKVQVLRLKRDLIHPPGAHPFSSQILRGNSEAGKTRWYKASEIWLDVLRQKAGDPYALANLGIFFEINRDYDAALSAYQHAAQTLGEPWWTYYREVLEIKNQKENEKPWFQP